MANFIPKYGKEVNLTNLELSDGNFIVTWDTGDIYMDINFGTEEDQNIKRIKIGTSIEEDTIITGGTAIDA